MSRATEYFRRTVDAAFEEEMNNGNVETLMPPERRRVPVGQWEMRAHLERDTRPMPPRDIFSYAARCMP